MYIETHKRDMGVRRMGNGEEGERGHIMCMFETLSGIFLDGHKVKSLC